MTSRFHTINIPVVGEGFCTLVKCLKNYLLASYCFISTFLLAQTTERRNLAVYEFEPRGVSSVEAQVISDRIRIEIDKLGVYNIIERGLMEEVLREQAFQLTGACTESSCLVEVGRMLAVHYIVGGSVSKIGKLFTIETRIIDVESGDIVNSVIEDYNGPIENLIVQTTKIVAAKICGQESDDESLLLTGTCDLLVQSDPVGGTIYIDNKPIGDVTPYRLEGLREGDYTVRVRKGSLVGEITVSLNRNDRKEINVKLATEQFILRIYSDPDGADVLINQENIGKTPIDYTVTDTTISYQVGLRRDFSFNLVDTVHFSNSTMLRLNYTLDPCGQIEIPYQDGIDVFLSDIPLGQLPNVIIVGNAFSNNRRWVIDQLDLSDYKIQINKKHHTPFLSTVTLTPIQPLKSITYRLQLINANVALNSNIDGFGNLRGNSFIPFQLNAGLSTQLTVPFGTYTLLATAPGYLTTKQELTLYKSNPDPISIVFIRPDKTKAIKCSLVFPGLGQYYSRQEQKGLGLAAVASLGIVILSNSVIKYNQEHLNYNDLADKYTDANNIIDMDKYKSQLNNSRDHLNNYRLQFMLASAITLLSYSWNIYDITRRYPYD